MGVLIQGALARVMMRLHSLVLRNSFPPNGCSVVTFRWRRPRAPPRVELERALAPEVYGTSAGAKYSRRSTIEIGQDPVAGMQPGPLI